MSANPALKNLDVALRDSELRLRQAINAEMKQIEAEFGIAPSSLAVYIHEVTTVGSTQRDYVLGQVRWRVEL